MTSVVLVLDEDTMSWIRRLQKLFRINDDVIKLFWWYRQ